MLKERVTTAPLAGCAAGLGGSGQSPPEGPVQHQKGWERGLGKDPTTGPPYANICLNVLKLAPHPGNSVMNSHPLLLFLAGVYLPPGRIPLLQPSKVDQSGTERLPPGLVSSFDELKGFKGIGEAVLVL